MESTTVRKHLDSVLAAGDKRGAFLQAAEALTDAARRDPKSRQALKEVLNWLGGPIVSESSMETYRRIRRPGAGREFRGPEGFAVGLTVGFLSAEEALSRPDALNKIRERTQDSERMLDDVKRGLGSTEPGFAGEVLVAAEVRANSDAEFANKLGHGMNRLRELAPQLRAMNRKDDLSEHVSEQEGLVASASGGTSITNRPSEPADEWAGVAAAVVVATHILLKSPPRDGGNGPA